MLLPNLAEPEWISVQCHDKILEIVWCSKSTSMSPMPPSTFMAAIKNSSCSLSQIMYEQKCLQFERYLRNDQQICTNKQVLQFTHQKLLFTLIKAVEAELLAFLTKHTHDSENIVSFTHEKHLQHIWIKKDIVRESEAAGYFVCSSELRRALFGPNVHKCRDGSLIAAKLVCDGIIDCPNKDSCDETSSLCDNIFPLHFYNGNHTKPNKHFDKYILKFDGAQHRKMDTVFYFNCTPNQTIDSDLVGDLVPDCGAEHEDELSLISLLKFGRMFTCQIPEQIPCKHGHTKCYNMSEICTYRLNRLFHLSPCRNGGHLLLCSQFECSAKFKCYFSYCIPWSYICDRKWDCPNGEDEFSSLCEQQTKCVRMFKCHRAKYICLHMGNVCDGNKDCPESDDESYCSEHTLTCPVNCECAAWMIQCERIIPETTSAFPFAWVSIQYLQFKYLCLTFLVDLFAESLFLRIFHGEQIYICNVSLPKQLLHFEIMFYNIPQLVKDCIVDDKMLTEIIVSNNNISALKGFAFRNLPALKLLNLSSNPFPLFPKHLIQNCPTFHTLLMKDTGITFIDPAAFSEIDVHWVEPDSYHVCCSVPMKTHCTKPAPWYISCSDLLPSETFRILFGSIAVVVLFANITSCVFHSRQARMHRKSFVITVIVVNFSDFLCGWYLSVIWISDIYYRHHFLNFEKAWKSSVMCFTAAYLMIFFTILSEAALLFLSISRYYIVTNPWKDIQGETAKTSAQKSIGALLFCSIAASITIVLLFSLYENSMPMRLCLPFLDPANCSLLSKLFAWFSATTQVTNSAFILLLYISLGMYLQKMHHQAKEIRASGGFSLNSVLAQLVIVSVSNVICWCPTSILYISAMFLPRYPVHLVIWATVCVTPMNSVINPLVFMSTTWKKASHQRKSRRGNFLESRTAETCVKTRNM